MKGTSPLDQRVPVPMNAELVKAIDEWRRHQPDLPNRAEAIRRLVQLGIAKTEAAATPPPARRNRAPRTQ